ncbi:factor-independent urate hydroxylase [Nocardioides ungokensis]|uniref:factor-independent urate hydroxylase n=1 Tax=Nocardioides ungokensis TaxID=1643322 RepID=UPI0015DFC26F|nr:urate oxidase [Nocardioides ungokensis]
MGIVLGTNRYGKADTRVFRIVRDTDRHVVRDLNVSTSLTGDFAAAHLEGDQAHVLPTDTQKNTVFAFAKKVGIGAIEDFGLALAHHFVDDVAPVTGAEVRIEEYAWERIADHDHGFRRGGPDVRTTRVAVSAAGTSVVSGVRDLVVLKSTGSEFAGFLVDDYTTLAPTHDRVLATSLTAGWTYAADVGAERPDWDATYDAVRRTLLDRFAHVHSLALQQSLWEMGRAVLEAAPSIASIELVAPNIHHIAVDLTPFGLANDGEVFHVTDRPYGLIEVTVGRGD